MCTCPMPALRWPNGHIEFLGRNAEGRPPFIFNSRGVPRAYYLQIPCGQCAECRLKRSREWAVRCMHEASMHRYNSFVTLTYRDIDGVTPSGGVSLNYAHVSGWLKRLRSRWPKDRFSFFAAGEYGETNPITGVVDGGLYRAHFHVLLFGFAFPDSVPCRLLGRSDLHSSALLDETWGHGDCKIGEVTFESAAYVARYAMKKVTGDRAKDHYTRVLPTGEIIDRTPEMLVMSKRPAIGKRWFEKFGKTAVYRDSVIARGAEMALPRYYDKLLPDVIRGMLLRQRLVEGRKRVADHTDERNNVRDVVVRAGMNQFHRE